MASAKKRYSVTLSEVNVMAFYLARLKGGMRGTLSELLDELLSDHLGLGKTEKTPNVKVEFTPEPSERRSKMIGEFLKKGGKK